MGVSSHEDSAGEVCCAGFFFSMNLLGFMTKAIRSVNTEETAGNIFLH